MRRIWTLALALLLILAPVFAADVTVTGTADKGSYTAGNTAGSATGIVAGHVYEVNLDIQEGSDEWAGIYGLITGKIVLGDGTSTFFEWTLSTLPSYIYLTYDNDINWSSVAAATDASDFETVLNQDITWTPTNEPVSATFTTTHDCGTGTTTIAALVYGDYNGDSTIDKEWPVCAYKAMANGSTSYDRAVYAAAVNDNGKAYNNADADYEAIVATNSTGVTIHFWKLD